MGESSSPPNAPLNHLHGEALLFPGMLFLLSTQMLSLLSPGYMSHIWKMIRRCCHPWYLVLYQLLLIFILRRNIMANIREHCRT
jgi:hypothetical protein